MSILNALRKLDWKGWLGWMAATMVARAHGVNADLVFNWCNCIGLGDWGGGGWPSANRRGHPSPRRQRGRLFEFSLLRRAAEIKMAEVAECGR